MQILSKTRTSLQKGFTLVELLVVIAIIGVIAAVTLAFIDPVDRIRAANDSKVMQDVVNVSKAAESYAANHDGAYPDAATGYAAFSGALVTAGDLRVAPAAPSGYTPIRSIW